MLEACPIEPESFVFYDAKVLLGKKGDKQTKKPVRLVGYTINGIDYWVATSRFDLSAEEVAQIYKLRWEIKSFFAMSQDEPLTTEEEKHLVSINTEEIITWEKLSEQLCNRLIKTSTSKEFLGG